MTRENQSMKHLFIIAALAVPMALHAQNRNVVSAYNYMGDGNYAKAVEYIEPAIANETTSTKEKTWRYRGTIYARIATGTDDALKQQFPDALQKAIESFLRANELDEKGHYKEENQRALHELRITALNNGVEAFNKKEFGKAISEYALSERIAEAYGQVDTSAVFNSAVAYEAMGDTAMAIERYAACIAMGYDQPEVFRYLASLQKRSGDLNAAIATTQQGLAKHTDHKELMLDQVAFLLEANRMEEAEVSVKAAIQADPANPVLYSVLGSLYDGKANPKEGEVPEAEMIKWYNLAEEAYKQSIEADPAFFDGYYNIGVLYNNRAAYEYEKCNQIKDDAKYNACKKVADDIYLKTVPYFEKAHELRPEDVSTMQQLKILYAKTGDTEKYNAIKQELGE